MLLKCNRIDSLFKAKIKKIFRKLLSVEGQTALHIDERHHVRNRPALLLIDAKDDDSCCSAEKYSTFFDYLENSISSVTP